MKVGVFYDYSSDRDRFGYVCGLPARSMMRPRARSWSHSGHSGQIFILDCMVIRERAGESKKIERALSEME